MLCHELPRLGLETQPQGSTLGVLDLPIGARGRNRHVDRSVEAARRFGNLHVAAAGMDDDADRRLRSGAAERNGCDVQRQAADRKRTLKRLDHGGRRRSARLTLVLRRVARAGPGLQTRAGRPDFDPPEPPVAACVRRGVAEQVIRAGLFDDAVERLREVVRVHERNAAGGRGELVQALFGLDPS